MQVYVYVYGARARNPEPVHGTRMAGARSPEPGARNPETTGPGWPEPGARGRLGKKERERCHESAS